jgi:hypothetical protein
MLRHPFHGIIGPEASANEMGKNRDQRSIARRTFFGRVLAAAAGIGALFVTRPGLGQTPPGGGRGIGFPEGPALQGGFGGNFPQGGALQGGFGGGIRTPPPGGGGPPTTLALGEEGGGPVTTQALGEEGGGQVTTFALGEEGGFPRRRRRRPQGAFTTFALGEEGGGFSPQRATTFALGEEGGGINLRR